MREPEEQWEDAGGTAAAVVPRAHTSNDSLLAWSRWGWWSSLHLAILPFIQGCMFSLGFYLVKAKIVPWLVGTRRR